MKWTLQKKLLASLMEANQKQMEYVSFKIPMGLKAQETQKKINKRKLFLQC